MDINQGCSREAFRYVRCKNCNSYSLANVPPDLSRHYPAGYYALPNSREEADRSTAGEEYKLELIRRYVTRGRLLEIGPGAGMFAYLASKRGFQVEAIEMSAQSAAFIEGVLGLPVHRTSDEIAALNTAGAFDVIAMWHVIEHVRDPAGLVAAAAAKLNRGGILIVATPNPSSLQFKALGRHWVHVDAPRHVHLISAAALGGVARRCGLTTGLVTSTDEGARYWNVFGWRFSCARFFDNPAASRVSRRFGSALSRLMAPVEAIEGIGSAYTAIFRKDAA
jgi:SAM-dependent methyltransferase